MYYFSYDIYKNIHISSYKGLIKYTSSMQQTILQPQKYVCKVLIKCRELFMQELKDGDFLNSPNSNKS